MRSTTPTLRRRNFRWSRHHPRQIGEKVDGDSDSDADDEAPAPLLRPNRLNAVVGGSTLGAGAKFGPGIGSTAGPLGNTLAVTEEAEEPDSEPEADGLEADGPDSEPEAEGLDSDPVSEEDGLGGVESETDGDVSESGDETGDEESLPALASPARITASATASTIGPPAATSIASTTTPLTTTASVTTASTTTSLPPPAQVMTPGESLSATSTVAVASSSTTQLPPPLLAPIGSIEEDLSPILPIDTVSTSSPAQLEPLPAPFPTAGTSLLASTSQSSFTTASSPSTTGEATVEPTQVVVPVSETPSLLPTPAADIATPAADQAIANGADTGSTNSSTPQLTSGEGGGMNIGSAVGIVFGVLALVALLLLGGWLLLKKMRGRRNDSSEPLGLPSFSFPKFGFGSRSSTTSTSWRFWDGSASASDRSTAFIPPLPPPIAAEAGIKRTNSEMVDDLMRAAYASESGNNFNDLETRAGRFDEKEPNPNYLDEKAYTALQGGKGPYSPLPPVGKMPAVGDRKESPKTTGTNPLTRWLDATITPHQSRFGPPTTAGLPPDGAPRTPLPPLPQPSSASDYYG